MGNWLTWVSALTRNFLSVLKHCVVTKQTKCLYFAGPTAGADEMVGLLVNAGLFDQAIVLAQCFSLSLNTIFENLALR